MSRITALIIILVFAIAGIIYAQELWVGKDGNIRNVEARALFVSSQGAYFATRRELYRSPDIKTKWEEIFSLPAGDNEINCLTGSGKYLFIGTRRGLFRVLDGGNRVNNVFRTIIPEKNNINCVEISRYEGGGIFLGTQKGIFMSQDLGSSWRDISINLKNKAVRCIGLAKDDLYAACEEGLYSKRYNEDGWRRLFVNSALENSGAESETVDMEAEEKASSIGCIAFRASRIYIGKGEAILYSDDGGKTWSNFTASGLGGAINYILASEKSEKLYCATAKGVFEYDKDKERWMELYRGMDKTLPVRSIFFYAGDEKAILAVTDGGLYRIEAGGYMADQYVDIERNLKSFKVMFNNEPTFRDLQQAAMKFNEVSPDKIKRWRKEARLKALAPKVSVGYDRSRSTNYEIYTSATRDYVAAGPEDLNSGLDVSVSWELADLIWSDDQTNIDVRSRLTTQLRNDILDDLRRAYYERRRLQFEMAASPPRDLKSRFEKEMRMQELTQAIDDLTGNYLSEHMRK